MRHLPARYVTGRARGRDRIVSNPGTGWRGISSDRPSEIIAMQAANVNTAEGEISHR